METEKIIKIKKVQCHCYDGTQCETAIYAKSNSRPGYRWYVGYGADKLPASKADLANMRDYYNQEDILLQTQEECTGEVVYKYRRINS
jgi:hypothetical protein